MLQHSTLTIVRSDLLGDARCPSNHVGSVFLWRHYVSASSPPKGRTSLADEWQRGRVISIFLIIIGSVLYVYAKTDGDKKPPQSHAIPMEPKALERGLGDVVFDEKEEKRREMA